MTTIVHIDNSRYVTGAYAALVSLCASMPNHRHIWVVPTGSQITAELRNKYAVYELPFSELSRRWSALLIYVPRLLVNSIRLRRILKREQADIVHVNDLYNLTGYFARFALGRRIPIVVHVRFLQRSFPAPIYEFWKRWHLRFADRIIAVSHCVARDWQGDPRVDVIYDAPELAERGDRYSPHERRGSTVRFVYLANYIDGKGQDDALRAIQLAKQGADRAFTVDFVGGASTEKSKRYREELESLSRAMKLDEVVGFRGGTNDVETTIKSYDAVLHFSRSESFGMVCYEALYYGVPVISTACGGPEELIEDGVSGVLVPTGDIRAYADAILTFMAQPEAAALYSEAGRASVRIAVPASRRKMHVTFEEFFAEH